MTDFGGPLRDDERRAALEDIESRAAAVQIATERRSLPGSVKREYLHVQMPNGRNTRKLLILPRRLEGFAAAQFEQYFVVGDYHALANRTAGTIEAEISTGSFNSINRFSNGRAIKLLPGVQLSGGSHSDESKVLDEEDATVGRDGNLDHWKLVVHKDDISIEISPASSDFAGIFSEVVTIKIHGADCSRHDEAMAALEKLAGAMLFELDIVYNVAARLTRRRENTRVRRSAQPERPPQFPVNEYASQALELYQYGRAAVGLPLLQYLAYYQSVEYFFPFFAREQTINAVRSQLLHPSFDPRDDVALSRLMSLSAPASRGGMAERDQLRATLRAAVQEADLREFFESDATLMKHFEEKPQRIKGVEQIQLKNNKVDLRDQVADRIYTIRCRIVHSKQDGGGSSDEVILPLSREADSLRTDLELLRVVAQRVLVARAARV